MYVLLLFILTVHLIQIDSARILGIIPTAFYSHQVPFQPLWRELSLRGHQVTVMTTNPQNDPLLKNLTEIDMSYTYDIYKKYNFQRVASDENNSFFKILGTLTKMLEEAGRAQLSSPEVQNLIHNKDLKFDLLIVEAQLPGMMAFSWIYKCPMIGIASLDAAMQYHQSLGNLKHPAANPDLNLNIYDTENMTFKERLISFIYNIAYSYVIYNSAFPKAHEGLKKIFGEDLPSFDSLQNNMSLLLINTHPIFHNNMPLNPNTITIGGGIHIKEPKSLPKELQHYLDNATEGVIYFSLGSVVKKDSLSENFKEELLGAFAEIPYKVLLISDMEVKNVPVNVRIEKWLPQQDLLRHPNVKLFITQGGLQSLQEAILNGIPLIGIPFLGDQIYNVNRLVKKGYGLKLHKDQMTKESLKNAITEIMNNPKYREKAKEMGDIFRDEQVPSIQKAIWWIEYVIRHKGAPHLKSPLAEMPIWKYYMLDVMSFICSIGVLFFFTLYTIIKIIFKKIVKTKSIKQKVQ